MAASFIGKPISLTSHSDIRYRGVLAGIDTVNSTIQLSQVYSLGTEGRKPVSQFIAANPVPYEYIVFRASEVKDLSVENNEENQARDGVREDPAVVGASQQAYSAQGDQQVHGQQQTKRGAGGRRQGPAPESAKRGMENVERAMNDLHVAKNKQTTLSIPTEDFDFQSSNARFDKSSSSSTLPASHSSSQQGDEEEDENAESSEDKDKAYDRSKSFFDTFDNGGAPGTQLPSQSREARNERKQRREEERTRNLSTFGEALPSSTSIAQRTGQWSSTPPPPPPHYIRGGGRGRGYRGRGGPRGAGVRGVRA